MSEAVRLGPEDLVHQVESLCGPAQTPQHHRKIGSRRREARCNFERPTEQRLRILQSTNPSRQLGQHAYCANVERIFFQMGLEDALRDVEAICLKGGRGFDQARMPVSAARRLGRHWL